MVFSFVSTSSTDPENYEDLLKESIVKGNAPYAPTFSLLIFCTLAMLLSVKSHMHYGSGPIHQRSSTLLSKVRGEMMHPTVQAIRKQ